jgi:hypothetical protein
MTPDSVTPAPEAATALPRELRDFLIQLSIGIHRYGMYPEEHPSLAPTVENVLSLLSSLLLVQSTLSVGVARNQLVIEGVTTDTKNPVFTDLASRLHRHHVGAVSFFRGVDHPELHEFFRTLAVDPSRGGQPVGLDPRFREEVWPHIHVYPLSYERLKLLGDQSGDGDETEESREARTRAARLWLGLARAALARGDDAASGPDAEREALADSDPTALARAITTHGRDSAYDQVIVGYMLQIADEIKSGATKESAVLQQRVSQLVSSLERGTLSRLLDMSGDAAQRRQFLLSAAAGMNVDAVVDLVQAAAETQRQTISHSLLRMLQKLAQHAEGGHGNRQTTAEASVREQVSSLIRDWSLKDPNPDAYRTALQRMATSAPVFSVSPDAQHLPEPRRLLEMALEVDVMGDAVGRALDALVAAGDLRWVFDRLKGASAPTVVAAIQQRYATSAQIEQVLAVEPLDVTLLDELIEHVGLQAAEPMLDSLIASESRASRRILIDRLIALGPDVGPYIVQRLADERWFVTRNMLALLGELSALPTGFDASAYMHHDDARVRREALRILLRDPAVHDRAVCVALADADDHVVRLGLTAAARSCPDAAIPLLVTRATTGANVDQRVTATRVLAGSGHPAALDTLLALSAPRRGWFGIRRRRAKSREYLAALAGLTRFAADPRARKVLSAAANSRDPEIVQTALGTLDGDT